MIRKERTFINVSVVVIVIIIIITTTTTTTIIIITIIITIIIIITLLYDKPSKSQHPIHCRTTLCHCQPS
jgi:c-di-AMP phosphodiesterase-like protein